MPLTGFCELWRELEELAVVSGEEVAYWWRRADSALEKVLFFLFALPLIAIWAKLTMPGDLVPYVMPLIAFGPLLAGIYLLLVGIGPLKTAIGLSAGAVAGTVADAVIPPRFVKLKLLFVKLKSLWYKLLRTIAFIIFFEFLFGMYVWLIPIEDAPALVLVFLALLFMLAFAGILGPTIAKVRPFLIGCLIIVTILFFFGGIEGLRARATEARSETPTKTSAQPKPLGPPFLREDAPQREAQGIGDHRREDEDYFNVDPTPISPINGLPEWSEWLYAPDSWKDWGKEFIGSDVEYCQAWFTYFNSGKWYGPYDINHLPEFTNPPPIDPNYPKTKWRVATSCTLRYFRRG